MRAERTVVVDDGLTSAFADRSLPITCVQGLGFVGAAMAVAVASARDALGRPRFNVIGVDLPTVAGRRAIEALNAGDFPSATTDMRLIAATRGARETRNLLATDQEHAYALAEVIVCDINLDLSEGSSADVDFSGFERGIRTIGRHMRPGALVIVETTVPPGTCENVVAPALRDEMMRRGESPDAFLLAHSFERVMPGPEYLDSIINFWRVFAGHTPTAAMACRAFLEAVVNTKEFPLTELSSITASETTKVMENSYRAVNIAFIDEWARFAEVAGVDLYEVIAAIRRRPTHSNIRQPGFGVGGYCLTKDPLFVGVGAKKFASAGLNFPFCEAAVRVNRTMPLRALDRLDRMVGGVAGKRIALFGVSYRSDVADTRYSPSEAFLRAARERGAVVIPHDPLVTRWEQVEVEMSREMPPGRGIDAAVFAVAHREYRSVDVPSWLAGGTPAVLDANDVLSAEQRGALRAAGCRVESIGRGGDA